MKKILTDVFFGILVFLGVMMCEFIVTLPFGEPINLSREEYSWYINRELLLTAIPSFFVTFVFSLIFKTNSRTDAFRRSITWTIVLAVSYLGVSIGYANSEIVFGNIGLYILLACAFMGPIIYARILHFNSRRKG